jgi:amidase
MAETTWLDATAQADLVRRGEVSPKELAEAAIAAIEAVNPRRGRYAVIRTQFDAARVGGWPGPAPRSRCSLRVTDN